MCRARAQGPIVLPVLGAVPDAAIVFFSGIGPGAQAQLSVGTHHSTTIRAPPPGYEVIRWVLTGPSASERWPARPSCC